MIFSSGFADNSKEMQRFLKKLPIILFFWLLAFPPSALCQVDTAWVRHYNGTGDSTDEAHAMAVDDSGNVYITGWSFGGTATGMDYATIKYDRNGNQLWLKRFNGSANSWDYSADIALNRKGNVYVAGSSHNLTNLDDYATVKYDSQGNQQWTAIYNGPLINSIDGANALTIDDGGNIYITGVSESTNVGGVCGSSYYFDYVTMKYDSNGNRLWTTRYSNPPDYVNSAYLIEIDKTGNVYVSGQCFNWCQSKMEWVTVKYDSAGIQQWVQRIDAGLPPLVRTNVPTDMKLGSNGDIYLTGGTIDSATFQDYTTIKYDPQGNQLWRARFDGNVSGYDYARAMVLDSLENVYVTGDNDAGIVTIKYDSSGNQLWVQTYSGPGSGQDWGKAITLDTAGNVYVAGVSFGSNSTFNFAILKYDSNGSFLWEKRFEEPVADWRQNLKISVDQNGNIYLAGTDLQNGRDFVTIKYFPLPALKGDLNLDGILTLADVVLMLNFTFNGDPFAAAPTAGDLNCDGKISPADAVIMLQMFFLATPAPC